MRNTQTDQFYCTVTHKTDTDGLISLLLMCRFCDMMGKKYSYYVNGNRYHGFNIPLKNLEGYLVIASDFTVEQEEVEAIVQSDIVLLSTDHHECQNEFIHVVGETAEGIVINNQYPFEPEEDRYLSGAGVFYELICSLYPEFESKENKALVGITLLSDMRAIENDKAYSYLRTTYTSDTSQGYFNYIITSLAKDDFSFGHPKLDRNYIDYTLSPTINALLRADMTDIAVKFILGYGLTPNNAREIQKQLLVDMNSRGDIYPFSNVVFLVVNTSNFLDYSVNLTNYIGLFCSDYKDKHNNISVLGMVLENGYVVRASFRGRYDDVSYLRGMQELGVDAHGHPSAFGIPKFFPVDQTWYDIDNKTKQLEEGHVRTFKIMEVNNLGFIINRNGMDIATKNCYVRDMYRTYFKYKGKGAKLVKTTYQDDKTTVKYMEYMVDGKKVKSFGVSIEDGIILPILEKGYINLYIRSEIV